MPATEETREALKGIIETCRDGEQGYLHAAARVEDPALKAYFEKQSVQRGRFAADLEEASQRLGDLGASYEGTIAGLMHRTWFDVKADAGGGDHEILVSVEQGEDHAKKAFERALNTPLPEMLLAIIREQYDSVKAANERVRSWRDRKWMPAMLSRPMTQ